MVETAFTLMLALIAAFLIFELSMFAYTLSVLNDAGREAVRYAIVHGSDSTDCSGPTPGCGDLTGNNVSAVATQYATHSVTDITAVTATVAYPDGQSTPLSRVSVTVSYTYPPLIGLFTPGTALQLTSWGRILY